ncbi:putative uroporphyrin-III C-methyltransferase [Vibrio parahaemolyticus AQ3810]|nr:putative uroporphyrin-III C-methyltransferase [Vibrio parahaemolyticus AQ3810]
MLESAIFYSQRISAKPAEPTKVEFEEKQGKRGVKLGTVAIILSIIFGGGLAYKLHEQQADYQAQIAQLLSSTLGS